MSKERYLKSIEDNLRRNATSLKLELDEIFEMKFSPEVDIVDFVLIDTPSNTDLMIYCMNLEGEEVFTGYGESCFAGSEKVIENLSIFKVDEELDLEKIYDESPEVEHEVIELITSWFENAFDRAGGRDFKLPCYFGLEDDIKSYSLKKRKWVLSGSEKYN